MISSFCLEHFLAQWMFHEMEGKIICDFVQYDVCSVASFAVIGLCL
jgi:hypothetical protein